MSFASDQYNDNVSNASNQERVVFVIRTSVSDEVNDSINEDFTGELEEEYFQERLAYFDRILADAHGEMEDLYAARVGQARIYLKIFLAELNARRLNINIGEERFGRIRGDAIRMGRNRYFTIEALLNGFCEDLGEVIELLSREFEARPSMITSYELLEDWPPYRILCFYHEQIMALYQLGLIARADAVFSAAIRDPLVQFAHSNIETYQGNLYFARIGRAIDFGLSFDQGMRFIDEAIRDCPQRRNELLHYKLNYIIQYCRAEATKDSLSNGDYQSNYRNLRRVHLEDTISTLNMLISLSQVRGESTALLYLFKQRAEAYGAAGCDDRRAFELANIYFLENHFFEVLEKINFLLDNPMLEPELKRESLVLRAKIYRQEHRWEEALVDLRLARTLHAEGVVETINGVLAEVFYSGCFGGVRHCLGLRPPMEP